MLKYKYRAHVRNPKVGHQCGQRTITNSEWIRMLKFGTAFSAIVAVGPCTVCLRATHGHHRVKISRSSELCMELAKCVATW